MTAKFMNESSREEIMSSSFYYVCVYQISRQSTIWVLLFKFTVYGCLPSDCKFRQNIPVLGLGIRGTLMSLKINVFKPSDIHSKVVILKKMLSKYMT